MDHQKFINHKTDPHHTCAQAVKIAMRDIGVSDMAALARHGWAGPLQPLVHNPHVSEIILPHEGQAWVITTKGERTTEPIVVKEKWVDFLPEFWFRGQDKTLPEGIVRDTLLFPDGSGIRYVYSPRSVSQWGPSLYIRRIPFSEKAFSLNDLVKKGSLPETAADLLRVLLQANTSMIVAGSTSSGKTTLLTALIAELQKRSGFLNLLIVERSHEIAISERAYRWAEGPNTPLDVLAEKATQMGLDWLVLGECTGGEAYFVSKAYTQGVPALSTLHAWNAAYAFKQLALLSQEYEKAPPPRTILNSLAALGMFTVQLERKEINGRIVRRLVGIAEIIGVMNDDPVVNYWWKWNDAQQELVWNPGCLNEMGASTAARLSLANVTIPIPDRDGKKKK